MNSGNNLKKKQRERERKRKFKTVDEVEEGEIQEDHRRVRVREEADLPIKKRSKYRLETSGLVLKPQEFVSVINQN
ncbi:unnamed protein product [Arabis nemorensis]|uniref:Uncharacterized protein n=1 Tax=Arabis nemorensis TaxID=586526 RepID=A0A565CK36_9BRAS|nr:unnamed protein product [Arabis nemorensis]